MAWLGLGVFYTGVIVGIPTVTGVAEGVHHQKKVNEEAAQETRMAKFYLDVFCEGNSGPSKEVGGQMVVLKHGKVWLWPRADETKGALPAPSKNDEPSPHPFTGFYIMYPDDERNPPERGLVSTISNDPPMLNWIYLDKETHELKYGNRSQSIQNVIGPWDWTADEDGAGVTLEEWEGFVAVEEKEMPDGLKWALYYDRWDDDFGGGGKKIGGRKRVELSLERRVLPDEVRRMQEEAAEKKMQVKQSGDMKTTLNLR